MKNITNLNAKYTTNNSGITLIALIITIIVLLILAGVVLNLAIGERGIFNTAKESKTEHIIAEMREELELALNDLQLEKQGNATIDNVTQEWADNNKLKEYETIIEDGVETNQKTATMTKDGITVKFVIDEKLSIIEAEQITGNEQYQTITMNLAEGIVIDNKETKTAYDKPYSATVSGEGEYVLETLTVTMGEEPVTVDVGTGKINIEKVTGDIVITATAKKLELQITEPIIGTSTSATTSVNDNSQERGTKLYINFSATLEGTNCTIVYKEDNTKTIPFEVTKNGKYVFAIKGTYNGKSIEKEKEVEVNKYKSAKNLVKYDAGEWTKEEIEELKSKSLYNLGPETYTFGGFTVGSSRNASINCNGAGWGNTPEYEGWQILESEKRDGKTYVTKLVHAGAPENFAADNDGYSGRQEYLLSNGTRKTEYNTFQDGTEIIPRNWDMYKDKKLDEKGYIEEVHIMTLEEAEALGSDQLRRTGGTYFLATASTSYGLCCVKGYNGELVYGTGNFPYYWGIRPVVSMKDGVYIASGSGTEADPYVLAKE